MEKREWLKEKQLMIYAKYGYWVTQSSLDEVYISEDELVLRQIEALKELREKYPKLTKDINSDLFELMTNPNHTRIKEYNEQYATGMRNETENEMIEILHWLSIFESAKFTYKQKQLLIDVCSGFSYEGKHKDFSFLCKKLEKSKKEKCKMNKRQFTTDEMRKLFPNYYAKPQEYFDCYLNHSKKLDVYQQSVNESKRKGEYLRSISLQHSIFPMELDEVKENE